MNSDRRGGERSSVFVRAIHGIRLKYAAVSVVFLALSVALFRLGGPRVFGWYDFFAILTLILMVLTLFLMHCHSVIGPLEKLTRMIDALVGQTVEGSDPVRVQWNGKDEVACLTASLNGLLEAVQSRSIGLAEENRRLRGLVNSAESELVSMDANGRVVNIVHCPETMIPVPGLVIGSPPDRTVWGKELSQAFQDGLEKTVRTGERQGLELALRDGGGKTRRLKVSILRPHGSMMPLVRFRDLSASDGDRRVPLIRVAANVSRELANVFAVIRGIASRYENSDSSEVRELVRMANQAVANGETQMENMMILGGERRPKMKRWKFVDLLRFLRGAISEIVGQFQVEVRFDCPPDLPDVAVDERQLALALAHVVRNSVEAFGTVSGRIEISVRPCALSPEAGNSFIPRLAPQTGVLVSVVDNGPGMAFYVMGNVFNPFFTTKVDGRGLGLCIADAIIEAHGGGMRMTSTKGVGTTVEFFLPSVGVRAEEEEERMRREFPGGEVLIVDDNEGVLKITAALFRSQKIAAHLASGPGLALQRFTGLSGRLRAVFLDGLLGKENSSGLLKAMRKVNPETPIVLVSGYTREELEPLFAESPPDAYLMKPYTVAELQNTLESLKR